MVMDNSNKITWLNQGHEFWDQALLKDLLRDYQGERQVFVVPGAINEVDEVNMEMEHSPKVTVIITSDEEHKFLINDLYHPDMKILMTYPNESNRNIDGFLPIGYRPETKKLIQQDGIGAKSIDWFFAGQDTHADRNDCIQALENLPNGKLIATEGFAQGVSYEDYMGWMCRSKISPCPSGAVSPDSFRLCETLEAGGIPIVGQGAFFKLLFGDYPFPTVSDWSELPDLINHYKDRPDIANKCAAWWMLKKRELREKLWTA